MEKLPNKDIERMISFIKHEAEEKVKEIEIKAIQDYNTEKAFHVKCEMDKIEKECSIKRKNMEINKLKCVSDIINKYNLEYTKHKNDIIDNFFEKCIEQLKNVPLSEQLINKTFKLANDEVIAMVLPRDKKIVRKLKQNVEIREMSEECIGGIILISKDKKTIIDNSYVSRIDSVKKHYLNEIVKFIF
ncbi:vacuolar atp synthase subunit e [Vairimorpha apis BRL 01]|uniref:Vacuolar atp synthase subunit e n=1 Tax=Vairimorpha apis BRL 01 TaxID=1037528 RepID=T0L6Z9_9MICR|nr:vacuolar atp synthase subunit e [Vairimorpha apis BRL 01]